MLLDGTLHDVEKRLIFREGNWRVRTREVPELGPFGSRSEAIDALRRHVIACEAMPGLREGEAANRQQHSIVTCKLTCCQQCEDILALCPELLRTS
ncbi:hypothetical protein FWJ25_08880 [Marinobacter salinexigens]|uniref:Uncharacterized protein n=1 Tax=Marinobacter salinexigens TaxID=2919747 RepID=A0A5B0VK55_9GAMM|nr:hypothetical protein [Marinobacter salinexigens]KAA1174341.1 hypothetical protein FWJ25_08880 [Marinobacter salinexigens]